MNELLQVIAVPIITAIITAFITYFTTKANNKTKIELAIKDKEVKLQELKNKILIKEIEIDQLKVQHDLELKSKEADVMNPIMGGFMKDVMNDPSKITKLLELQQIVEKLPSKYNGSK